MGWFLYDRDLRHERIKRDTYRKHIKNKKKYFSLTQWHQWSLILRMNSLPSFENLKSFKTMKFHALSNIFKFVI